MSLNLKLILIMRRNRKKMPKKSIFILLRWKCKMKIEKNEKREIKKKIKKWNLKLILVVVVKLI